jgi:outer membrane protein TolC
VVRLTLEEAKQRALANNKLLTLAALNIKGKEIATRVAQADYFPQILGNVVYFHFDSPLGDVLTTQGRHVQGLRGRTILDTPGGRVIDVAVVNQDAYTSTLMAAQPITALLKVRQGVKIARADERIAQAQLDQGARAVAAGVEQLYWGLIAAGRIRAGAAAAVQGAEAVAKLGTVEVRTALVEAKQGLQQAESQIADLEQQLNALLDQPACPKIEVVEPPFPPPPVTCADEAASLAVAASPEVREAEQNVAKAHAAVAAAKVDYLPNVAVVGGYANQSVASYVQPNIGYVGVSASWTLFAWGKRRNTVRERDNLVVMASTKLAQTQEEVQQKALKAFRELGQAREALVLAEQLARLRKEAEKEAEQPADLLKAAKATLEAEVDLVKADLAYRVAHVKLMSLICKP